MPVATRTPLFNHLSGLSIVVGLVVMAGTSGAAELPPRTDGEGFPLPAEAVARVGSVRLRHPLPVTHLEYSPDGTVLAASGSGSLRLWDAQTGKLVRQIQVRGGESVSSDGVFSADGKTVIVLAGQTCRWFDVRTGEEVRHVDLKCSTKGEDLDADAFAVREKAAAELRVIANKIEPRLRKFLGEKPSAEAKRQIEGILESIGGMTPERLREVRSVEVLERIGTAGARELLAKLAGEGTRTVLTREARAAVGRLTTPRAESNRPPASAK